MFCAIEGLGIGANLAFLGRRGEWMDTSEHEIGAPGAVRQHRHYCEAGWPASFTQGPESHTAIDVRSLPSGTELVVETRNTQYRLLVLDGRWNVLVQGGRHFRDATAARVEGSTFGGSLLKLGWITIGLFLEISVGGRRITTSRVRSISASVNTVMV